MERPELLAGAEQHLADPRGDLPDARIEKFDWVSLFLGVGIMEGATNLGNDPSRAVGTCPNFDDRACAAKAQVDATGAPNDATLALARHASVGHVLDAIRIPTLLAQGEADTLFNLQEPVATYEGRQRQAVRQPPGVHRHVRRQHRKRVRATTVLVDGKRVARLARGRYAKRISLKGRTRATVTVKLVMTLAGGRRVTDTRRYRTCKKRR